MLRSAAGNFQETPFLPCPPFGGWFFPHAAFIKLIDPFRENFRKNLPTWNLLFQKPEQWQPSAGQGNEKIDPTQALPSQAAMNHSPVRIFSVDRYLRQGFP
jgi:hypothetical protein